MLDTRTVISSIKDGASMSDVIEYISAWITEARALADTIDAVFFTNGLPEEEKEDAHAFFGRATASFHTLEMSLVWIQNAVDEIGKEFFITEKLKQNLGQLAEVEQITGEIIGTAEKATQAAEQKNAEQRKRINRIIKAVK